MPDCLISKKCYTRFFPSIPHEQMKFYNLELLPQSLEQQWLWYCKFKLEIHNLHTFLRLLLFPNKCIINCSTIKDKSIRNFLNFTIWAFFNNSTNHCKYTMNEIDIFNPTNIQLLLHTVHQYILKFVRHIHLQNIQPCHPKLCHLSDWMLYFFNINPSPYSIAKQKDKYLRKKK